MRERFDRSDILYGADAGRVFQSARVAVCGLGAVGSFAAEALARVGIGNFLLVDFDRVELSNVNRQLCALESTLGLKKTDVVKSRILDINPASNVELWDGFIDADSVGKILEWGADVVVDAIDTLRSKACLLECCAKAPVAVVSSMGAARRRDPLKVKVADLFGTSGCPLAAQLRRQLKIAGIKRGSIECVYSDESPAESSHFELEGGTGKPKLASTPTVTGTFGLNLANLAILSLLERGANFKTAEIFSD